MTKVFAISGSLVTENLENLGELAQALESHEEQVIAVTGAGGLKEYIHAAGNFGNQGEQDLVGITGTRLNAKTLMTAMDAYPKVPETAYEIREAASTGKNVVMGGLTPGHSTDAVAAIAAELLEADLYIATRIDGVYDRDPDEEGAEKFEEIGLDELRKVISGNNEAGGHELIDGTAVDIIERSSIETKLFLGTNENIENPGEADGTTVVLD
ncbi:UMP kinase [Candidatus Nanohalococcus occultus]|uniref:UMP kinase n=1 Tax=Candidatus Nanohalococcus occultus TaxID=2978047 RepID=A0ABY8CDP8_9ARCH|nr:Uridylate kinase [Candidatus Nanohaloarchaeota archaeon SVXNc]